MVTASRRRKAPAHSWSPDELHHLKTNYRFTMASRRDIAASLNLTVGQVSAQIHRMGLVRLSGTRRPWQEDEESRLSILAGTMPIAAMARELRRSSGSVHHKLSELGLSACERVDWYTKAEVCGVLGMSERTLQRHIDAGRLKASWYHGRKPGNHAGTAAWCIRRDDLRAFLRHFPGLVQNRNVDMLTFIDVLAGVSVRSE